MATASVAPVGVVWHDTGMKWFYVAVLVGCVAVGAVLGVIISRAFHLTILIAPALAVANGVSVYLALKRRIDAQGS